MLSRRTHRKFCRSTVEHPEGHENALPFDPQEPDPPQGGDKWEETSVAEEWRRVALVAGYLSAGGFQMVAAAGIGYLAGGWIDRRLGLSLVFAAILAMIGFILGVFQMWRYVQALQKKQGSG